MAILLNLVRDHARNENIKEGETAGREYRREVQESATHVVWPRKEAIPRR